MDNRGIASDPGWVNRKFHELERKIEALRSERRAASTTVSEGDFVVSGGGSIRIQDNGDLVVEDNGHLSAEYGDGVTAVYFGGTISGGSPFGTGLLLQDAAGAAALWLIEKDEGTFEIVLGPSTNRAAFLRAYAAGEIRLDSSAQAIVRGETGAVVDAGATGQVQLGLGSAGCFLGHGTTSSAANAYIDPNGFFGRVTSSRRYKEDIRDVPVDAAMIGSIFEMRPRTWRDKSTDPERDKENPTRGRRHIGFIAEELHDLGLRPFVVYDEEGRPDAIQYDRLCVALLAALQWLRARLKDERARIDALEVQVAAQQQQITDLAAQVASLTSASHTH